MDDAPALAAGLGLGVGDPFAVAAGVALGMGEAVAAAGGRSFISSRLSPLGVELLCA